jgi:hypothetical protein
MWVLWWWHMSIHIHCHNKEAVFTLEVRIIPGLSKAWQSRFSVKNMLIVFFNCWDLMRCVFVPRSETVIQELYLTIGWCLQKAVWKKWQELQQEHSWLLTHNNTHTILSRSFPQNWCPVNPHPPYGPGPPPLTCPWKWKLGFKKRVSLPCLCHVGMRVGRI